MPTFSLTWELKDNSVRNWWCKTEYPGEQAWWQILQLIITKLQRDRTELATGGKADDLAMSNWKQNPQTDWRQLDENSCEWLRQLKTLWKKPRILTVPLPNRTDPRHPNIRRRGTWRNNKTKTKPENSSGSCTPASVPANKAKWASYGLKVGKKCGPQLALLAAYVVAPPVFMWGFHWTGLLR